MKSKSEIVKKRILKSVGNKQAVILYGEWEEDFIFNLRNNENIVQVIKNYDDLLLTESNSCTRLVCQFTEDFLSKDLFSKFRDVLLPTGKLIVSAFHEETMFQKLLRKKIDSPIKIKPKVLQNLIHDNGFLIEGFYGYPENKIIMISEIQNKEVSTLFNSTSQVTIKNTKGLV